MPSDPERVTDRIVSSDGWPVAVEIASDPTDRAIGGALLVPATKHERDGWGPTMVAELIGNRFVVLSTDIRGRGDSRYPHTMYSLPPGHLRRVRDDVAAAVDRLAAELPVAPGSIVVFGEQDTADAVASVAASDDRVAGVVLVSPKLSERTIASVEVAGPSALAVCVLACKDDRKRLVDAVEVFRRCRHPQSRLRLVADVGSGTTMFAAWQYLNRDEPSLERWLGAWATSVVKLRVGSPDR